MMYLVLLISCSALGIALWSIYSTKQEIRYLSEMATQMFSDVNDGVQTKERVVKHHEMSIYPDSTEPELKTEAFLSQVKTKQEEVVDDFVLDEEKFEHLHAVSFK